MGDIEQNGIKDPIKYVKYKRRNYVVDGHHRLQAAKSLGLKKVPAIEVSLPYKGYSSYDDLEYDWGM